MTEYRDHELRDALWHASGDSCDTEDALLRVEARARRIRRRHMDVVGVSVLAALVLTLVIGSRASGDESPHRPSSVVTVAPPAVTDPATSVTPTTAVTEPPATMPAVVDTSAPPVVEPAPPEGDTASAAEMTLEETREAADSTEPVAEKTPAAAPPATKPSGTRSQQTLFSRGGRVTVGITGGALTLVTAKPRDGYTVATPTVGPTRIEVEFRSEGATSRIRVDLDHGRLDPSISNDRDSFGSQPGDDRDRPVRQDDSEQRRLAVPPRDRRPVRA